MHLSGRWPVLRGGTSPLPPHPDNISDSPDDRYTRPRHSRRRTNGSSGVHLVDSQPRSNSSATVLCGMFRMPPLFNLIRIGILVTVLLWTIIVLAIAIHFHGILTTNDLTRFIPFAIFVSAATIVLLLALLLFGLKKANPISTRIELGCLGLDGILWLVLAAFLVSSDAEDADVECFTSNAVSGQVPIEMPGFNTETYQAQYRVIEAFSLFNVILIWAFLLFLLFLAWRHHSSGQRSVWITPVTSFPWFYSSQDAVDEKEAKLPPPVTAPVDRSRSKGAGALNSPKDMEYQKRPRPQDLGKIRTTGLTPPPKTRQPSYEYKHGYWLPKSTDAPSGPPPPPPKATVSRSNTRDRQPSRDQSRESARSHERGRSHRSARDRSLTRGNSGSKRPAAGYPPARDRYFRDASPRR
jgi:hypothetical protein